MNMKTHLKDFSFMTHKTRISLKLEIRITLHNKQTLQKTKKLSDFVPKAKSHLFLANGNRVIEKVSI